MNNALLYLLLFTTFYITIQIIKSLTVGPTFSITKYVMYGKDYKIWYNCRQKYIPKKKRNNFSKNKK